MKKFVFLFIFFSLFSCTREENSTEFNGIYNEVKPIENRTQINFKSRNTLVILKQGSSDEFNYKINGSLINLSNNSGYSQDFEFEKISNNEFKIQNLYPSIPEYPTSYISFKK